MTVDAIKGTYANFRLVKSRGVCVIEVEVPVEASKHALDILGGMPVFGQDTWVALARLRESVQPDPAPKAIEAPEKIKQPLRASALAALMTNEPAFWTWLQEMERVPCTSALDAANWLRKRCGIESRRELDTNQSAFIGFQGIRDSYLAWRTVG